MHQHTTSLEPPCLRTPPSHPIYVSQGACHSLQSRAASFKSLPSV